MTETTDKVRVRIAPGPTGPFHIGRARTALLNWLFARRHGGVFVLRIEDTDQKRSRPEHYQSILESLRWLGLDWDEGPDVGGPYGPYFQMARLDTYRDCVQQLLDSGQAYHCYCTPEELDVLREQARAQHRPFRYPRLCLSRSEEDIRARQERGIKPAVRLHMPDEGSTSWDDLLLGTVSFQNSELDDHVIMKSEGIPTYNFAVVVDDVTMHITHVIRGQDHVSNTPRQISTYHAMGLQPPVFAHLPMVLGMDRGKLSARYGAAPLTAYGEDGYLPEAIFNYLATLGISYEAEREIFSREEIVERFAIERVGRSGAAFDEEKLDWMNGVYIRGLPLGEFVRRALPYLEIRGLVSTPPSEEEISYATAALALEQERVRTLAETPEAVDFFFRDELVYDPALLIVKKSSLEDARRVLEASLREVEQVHPFTHDALEPVFRALAENLGLKTGVVFGTIRVAITGRTAAPPLFDTMAVLNRSRVRERLQRALFALEQPLPEPVVQ